MLKKVVWVGLMVSVLGLMSAAAVRADEWNRQMVLTFSQPVELPGHVLPAGTYMFKLADTQGDRNIVQVFNADGSKIIATLMTIPDYRLTTTDQTVIKFREVSVGAPEAIRAWFYPGNSTGQEFVYPKPRALQLAKAARAVVPAVTVDIDDVEAVKAAPIVAITPDEKEVPVTAAIQTTPVDHAASVATAPNTSSSVVGTTGTAQTARNAETTGHLPKTASTWPMFMLFGVGAICAAVGIQAVGKRVTASMV